jgi:pimeloyl-ACP methyl ester carboxylesterase
LETVIIDSDVLRITATQGDTDIAIVAFSGVGLQLDGIPQEEFVTTLQGATHSQYFVVDKNRSWYNATALDIVTTLTPLLDRYRKVVTLGNSMGGFGAVYFASRLPNVRAAISFSPQFSVDPKMVPHETRWQIYRSNIKTWSVRHAMEQASGEPEMMIFFGKSSEGDAEHMALFQDYATRRTAILSLEEAEHGTARHLKRSGLLGETLDKIVIEEAGAYGVDDLLTRYEVPHTLWKHGNALP